MASRCARVLLCFTVYLIIVDTAEAASGILDKLLNRNYQGRPTVSIAQGKIVGLADVTSGGTSFFKFLGIPYAKPPIGDLRYRAPQPPEPWDGFREANSPGNTCIQSGPGAMIRVPFFNEHGRSVRDFLLGLGTHSREYANLLRSAITAVPRAVRLGTSHLFMSEDCLYLDVFTPSKSTPTTILNPVVVFIHGGAFLWGNAHRFLGTNSSDIPGNAGLKDQVMVLRWVRDNIREFGGDPNRVTLYGESAGSASTHLHLLSSMSRGLFHQVIMSSGSAQDPYAVVRDPDAYSKKLARLLGAAPSVVEKPSDRAAFLRAVPALVLSASTLLPADEEDLRPVALTIPLGPAIEPNGAGEPAFLSESPHDIVREGRFPKVPMMIGSNNKEGSLLFISVSETDDLPKIENDLTRLIPDHLYNVMNDDERQKLACDIRRMYFNNKPVSTETLSDLVDLYGDEAVVHGVHVSTVWHTKHSTHNSPVFVYQFIMDAVEFLSALLVVPQKLYGAGHADDLAYVFQVNSATGVRPLPENKRRFELARDRMIKLFTNFVKFGNPTPNRTKNVNVFWPPSRPGIYKYLEFGDNLTVKQNFLNKRMTFWDKAHWKILKNKVYDF